MLCGVGSSAEVEAACNSIYGAIPKGKGKGIRVVELIGKTKLDSKLVKDAVKRLKTDGKIQQDGQTTAARYYR